MKRYRDNKHVIQQWPSNQKRTSIGNFAKDIGVTYENAKKMHTKGIIPPKYWPKVAHVAMVRGIELTIMELQRLDVKARKAK